MSYRRHDGRPGSKGEPGSQIGPEEEAPMTHPSRFNRRRRPLVAMIALMALLAAACGAEGGKEAETPTKAEGDATPILLQRVDGPEEDAFMDSVAIVQLATFPSAVQEAIDGMADQ